MSYKPKRDMFETALYVLCWIGGLSIVFSIGVFLLAPGAFIKGLKRGMESSIIHRATAIENPFPIIEKQVMPCWKSPTSGKGYSTAIRVEFNRNGSVASHKIAKSSMGNLPQDEDYARFAFAAFNTFTDGRCFPLKNLPTAPYSEWKRIEFVFTEDTIQ